MSTINENPDLMEEIEILRVQLRDILWLLVDMFGDYDEDTGIHNSCGHHAVAAAMGQLIQMGEMEIVTESTGRHILARKKGE